MDETYLTQEGYQKLVEELGLLKTVKRRQISKAIGEARAHGDIGENAEYDAAKEAQALNEQRIAELEGKLSRVRIIDDIDIPKDQVLIGATVKLKDLDTGEEIQLAEGTNSYIYKNKVVYEDGFGGISMLDLSNMEITVLSSAEGEQIRPIIHEKYVVWTDYRNVVDNTVQPYEKNTGGSLIACFY